MLNRHNKFNTREEGFTLLELLIVISIIGALIAIAVPLFINQKKAATEAGLKNDVHNISVNIETLTVSNPNMDSTALHTAVLAKNAIITSPNNKFTVTGTSKDYFVCGETEDNQTEGYSSIYGIIDDCVLGQDPPSDVLNTNP